MKHSHRIIVTLLLLVVFATMAGSVFAATRTATVNLTTTQHSVTSSNVSGYQAETTGYNNPSSDKDVRITLQYSPGTGWKDWHHEIMSPGQSEFVGDTSVQSSLTLWRTKLTVEGWFFPSGCTANAQVEATNY